MGAPQVLYNTIGMGYNATRQADPYITDKLFEFLSPERGNLFLDIGCGTGNYTIALAEKGLDFYGVEPSEKMLDIAKTKNKNINWQTGFAEQIPTQNNMFNGVVATLTDEDIKTERFKQIHAKFENDEGDYLFITAEKKD